MDTLLYFGPRVCLQERTLCLLIGEFGRILRLACELFGYRLHLLNQCFNWLSRLGSYHRFAPSGKVWGSKLVELGGEDLEAFGVSWRHDCVLDGLLECIWVLH